MWYFAETLLKTHHKVCAKKEKYEQRLIWHRPQFLCAFSHKSMRQSVCNRAWAHCSTVVSTLLFSLVRVKAWDFLFYFIFFQFPNVLLHNSKTCYNPILVGEYLALLSQQYGIWVILLNMNGPFTGLNAVAWQWPFFPSLLHTQNNIQRSSLGTFPRNQQKRNSKLSLKPSKH